MGRQEPHVLDLLRGDLLCPSSRPWHSCPPEVCTCLLSLFFYWRGVYLTFRIRAYDDMYYLVDKYAPFEEALGPPRLKDFDRASLSKERDHTIE